MKPMVYDPEILLDILDQGVYKHHKYVILNLGTHPTAYAEDKLGLCRTGDKRARCIRVHGGITYHGLATWEPYTEAPGKTEYLGWDYAQYGDRIGSSQGREHTTEEIFEDVKAVVEQLIEMEAGKCP